jgi:N-acetylmuramoyl-L-alanine amidase
MRYLLALVLSIFSTIAYAVDNSPIIDKEKDPEMYCLAQNIFFEAATESYAGKVAVALVTLNRVQDSRFPNTICGVVYDAYTKPSWKDPSVEIPIRNKCQFSWYCDGKPDVPYPGAQWRLAQEIAIFTGLMGQYKGLLEGATHYHADYVKPSWRNHFTIVGQIDRHIFYRWD